MSEETQYVGLKEASEVIGVSSQTIRNWCRDGRLEGSRKEGNKWQVPYSALEKYNEDVDSAPTKAAAKPKPKPLSERVAASDADPRITQLLTGKDPAKEVSVEVGLSKAADRGRGRAENADLSEIVRLLEELDFLIPSADAEANLDDARPYVVQLARIFRVISDDKEAEDDRGAEGSEAGDPVDVASGAEGAREDVPAQTDPDPEPEAGGTPDESADSADPGAAPEADAAPEQSEAGGVGEDAVSQDTQALEALISGEPFAPLLADFDVVTDQEPTDPPEDEILLDHEIEPGEPVPPQEWEVDIDDPRESWED